MTLTHNSTFQVLYHRRSTMGRVCADCGRNLPQTSYTGNQWSKGQGISRCAGCVHGHHSDTPSAQPWDNGRYNNASSATFTDDALKYPFASGAFRWVAKGRYTSGARAGQACVNKWFKTGAVFEEDYFTLDIKAVDKALDIIDRFNQLDIVDKLVKINVPEVWTFDDDCAWAGRKGLQEPFIQNYQKFNSNTGWNDDTREWAQVMQALSRKYTPFLGTILASQEDMSPSPPSTPNGRCSDIVGQTSAITFPVGTMSYATSKAASTATKSFFRTPSSCPGPGSTASRILAPTALAPFSANITATTIAARTGPCPPINGNTSTWCPERP